MTVYKTVTMSNYFHIPVSTSFGKKDKEKVEGAEIQPVRRCLMKSYTKILPPRLDKE